MMYLIPYEDSNEVGSFQSSANRLLDGHGTHPGATVPRSKESYKRHASKRMDKTLVLAVCESDGLCEEKRWWDVTLH